MSRRRAAREDVTRRVAEIGAEKIARAADLIPVIDQLMTLAAKANTMKSAAAMSAARGLLAEAVKVKAMLPAPAAAHQGPWLPTLTRAEWIATFRAAKPPGPRLVQCVFLCGAFWMKPSRRFPPNPRHPGREDRALRPG